MMQKFSSHNKETNICICIHDILNDCKSGYAKEIAINLSDFMINRFLRKGFDVYIGTDEDILLSSTVDDGYDFAVVIATGTSFKLSDRLLDEIKNKCQEDFFVAGHIMDRDEAYFELHHQFYIVNLYEYDCIGRPAIGNTESIPHSQIAPASSEGSYIKDYVNPGKETKQYESKMHGWNIISQGLLNNLSFVDIGKGIRDNKKYFYYEYDHVFLKESTELFYNNFFFNNFIVGFNSDKFPDDIEYKNNVEQFVTVGTGLNWIKNLQLLSYNKSTKVVFTDYNPLVLRFMKALVEQWDGKDYVDFYLQHQTEQMLPNATNRSFEDYKTWCYQEWNAFKEKFSDWNSIWNNIKQLEYEYVCIDFTSHYDLSWLEPNKHTVMNISDLFDHVPVVHMLSVKYRIACENRLYTRLKEKDPKIVLMSSARSAQGFDATPNPYGFLPIDEVDLVDIETLRTPYWHTEDWKTLRPLM